MLFQRISNPLIYLQKGFLKPVFRFLFLINMVHPPRYFLFGTYFRKNEEQTAGVALLLISQPKNETLNYYFRLSAFFFSLLDLITVES
jgi:hypothetical protein